MNRRNFIRGLIAASAGFAILPAATTYARKWVNPKTLWVINTEWEKAPYRMGLLNSIWHESLYSKLSFVNCPTKHPEEEVRMTLANGRFVKVPKYIKLQPNPA